MKIFHALNNCFVLLQSSNILSSHTCPLSPPPFPNHNSSVTQTEYKRYLECHKKEKAGHDAKARCPKFLPPDPNHAAL